MPESFQTEEPGEGWRRDWDAEAAAVRIEMTRRLRLLTAIGDDPQKRALAWAVCKADVATFFRDWVFTYDPRHRSPLPKTVPFVPWPRQIEYLRWREERYQRSENGLVKKSRDLGVTWLNAGDDVHKWLFFPDVALGIGSRKQDLVDKKGDPKSIFWKIRFILDRLPGWFLPRGFELDGDHDNFLMLANPENGSTIVGEAGDNMGRGGRTSRYTIDEWAFVARAPSVLAAVEDNSDSNIFASTSAGTGTLHYQMEQDRHIPIFYFHFRDDPRKDAAWEMHKRMALDGAIGGPRFAREHDMDDHAALENQICPGPWVAAAVQWDAPPGTTPRTAGLDPADQGPDETVYCSRAGHEVRRLIAWGDDLDARAYLRIRDLTREDACEVLNYDRNGVGAGVAGAMTLLGATFDVRGIANGERVPAHWVFEDDPTRRASERFADIATALWWNVRLRLERTFELVNGIADHEASTCLSLPNDARLVAQLVSRKYLLAGDRVRLESKKQMRQRGVKSPDRAEALVYAFSPSLARSSRKGGVIETRSRAKQLLGSGW